MGKEEVCVLWERGGGIDGGWKREVTKRAHTSTAAVAATDVVVVAAGGAFTLSPLSISTPSDCVAGCTADGSLLRVFTSFFLDVSSNFFANSSGDANFFGFLFLRSFFAKKSSKSAIIGARSQQLVLN